MNLVDPHLATDDVPLVVDVDGTLIRTDLLHETALQYLAHHPARLASIIPWLLRGKAALKAALADHADPDIESLPLREETVDLIRKAQADGRPVYLASASDRRQVTALAERIGGIAGVFASDGEMNLAGRAKASCLVKAFGDGGFDYVGDRRVDFPVWKNARRALVVAHDAGFEKAVAARFPDAEIIGRERRSLRPYWRAMRPHQWAKNSLLFLPLLTGHHFEPETVAATIIAFLCFCAAASSSYILNDLLDLPADRHHPRKRTRPFASGDIPVMHGVVQSILLMAAAAVTSLLLSPKFAIILGLYVVSTLGYSLLLKRKLFIDVIALGGLYTLRVLAGLEAGQAAQSEWLLMVCLFLFMSLATVKRCSELINRRNAGGTGTIGRGYRVEDLAVLFPLAAAAGYGAALVVALYISSPEVMKLYEHPSRLWLVEPLLLYWISRILIMTNRGDLHDDPVIFACTDRISLLTGACLALVIGASL